MAFLKNVKISLSSSSLNVGQMVLIKYDSSTLRLRKFSGALLKMVHLNLWVEFSFKCLAGSDLLFLSSWSFYRISALRTVYPISKLSNIFYQASWSSETCNQKLLSECLTVSYIKYTYSWKIAFLFVDDATWSSCLFDQNRRAKAKIKCQ